MEHKNYYKGKSGERRFAEWLTQNGIRAWRDSASGGGNREKSDVGNNINANFEVKTVKTLGLLKAWKQTESAAEKTHNTPYLVVHFDGMRDGEWLMVMDNYSWLELYRQSRQPKNIYEPSKQLKYKLELGRKVLGEILKDLQ